MLDANVFIAAKNLHYGFDFCPAFWEWLVAGNRRETVYSIEKVHDELKAADDQLSDWAAKRGEDFFLKPDENVTRAMANVSTWVTGEGYELAAINTFLQVADYWLVSHALAHRLVVVTHEKPAANTSKKIKIPTVCEGLGIEVMTPFDMLRQERTRFVLEAVR